MLKLLWPGLVTLAVAGMPAPGETPTLFPDFSAKRIGVPVPGTRRLNIQIDPEAQRAALQAMPKPGNGILPDPLPLGQVGPKAQPHEDFAWFWERVSPALAESSPGRLRAALDTLVGRKEVPQPRLAYLQKIARANGPDILRATVGTRVSPALVLAVISVESAGNADAVSGAGAQGLMQLMPDTAARFGVSDSLDPGENITGGVRYLDWLMERFGGDPIAVLAGYNAGEGSLQTYAGVPPYPETRGYVPKVLAAYQVARGLCRTPPELLSDGCVFVGTN